MEDSNHINPQRKNIHVSDPDISSDSLTGDVKEKREQYAKMAHLMFSPITDSIDKIQYNESYWAKFDKFRKDFSGQNVGHSPQPFKQLPENDERGQYVQLDFGSNVSSSFWMEGFEILQNIEDRLSVEWCHGRDSDPLTDCTEYTRADDDACDGKDNDNEYTVKNVSFYCDESTSEGG